MLFRVAVCAYGCCTKLTLRVLLLYVFIAFFAQGVAASPALYVQKKTVAKKIPSADKAKSTLAAQGAEARQNPTVQKKTAAKKVSPACKAKTKIVRSSSNSELPALPPKTVKATVAASSKPGAGVSEIKADYDHQVRSELERYLGTRYKSGGTGRDGFDCSGFARSMYQKLFGVDLPHNAQSQFQLPMFARLNQNALKTGDLVFFAPTAKKKRINHVGIYLADGQFIHAESNRGIVISSIDDDHWRDRLVSAKRLESKAGLKSGAFDEISDAEDEQNGDDDAAAEYGMHVRYSSQAKRSFAGSGAAVKSSPGKKPQSAGLEYVRPIFGKYCSLHLGVFREDFDIYGDDSQALLADYDPYSTYSYSQGIRLASDIKPFRWMSITPSFLYYNHGHELDEFNIPTRSFALDVSLGSLADVGWSLSTGLKYASLSNAALRPTSHSSDSSLLDLSLTYSRRLTDSMQLSLMGLRSSVSDMVSDTRSSLRADQRVFFMLNYHY
jgi:cell wall-associated NlpC family hydrolase